ncbi:hypothetical protein ACVIGA_007418 [Bradyrhizobium sp. USDA 3240]
MIMMTGRPSVRAASILARAPAPPELRATIHAIARARIVSSSSSSVNWAARDDDIGTGQWQPLVGRVDEPQRIGMPWPAAERRDVLAADREEHVGATVRQRRDRRDDVRDLDPVIAGCSIPRRAFKREQRRCGLRAGGDCVAAHLGREGMRRVDHMRDALATQIVGKTADAAEAADPGRQRLFGRSCGAPAVGIDRVDARARDRRGKRIGVGRSAQDQGAHHG